MRTPPEIAARSVGTLLCPINKLVTHNFKSSIMRRSASGTLALHLDHQAACSFFNAYGIFIQFYASDQSERGLASLSSALAIN